MTIAPSLVVHDGIACLYGHNLANFQFISDTREVFVPVSLKPITNRLNIII
jgi:hypothetical protein